MESRRFFFVAHMSLLPGGCTFYISLHVPEAEVQREVNSAGFPSLEGFLHQQEPYLEDHPI